MLIAVLILCAMALMALEAFIPGISFAGIIGAALIVGGVWKCWASYGPLAGILLLVGCIGLSVLIMRLVINSMKHGRLSKTGVFMAEKSEPVVIPKQMDSDAFPIGRRGTAITALRPAGIAEFGQERVHVSSAGGFIEAGTEIQIDHIEGARIIVAPVYEKTEHH